MFAVTCYSGKLDHTLVMALMGSAAECAALGWEISVVMRCGDSMVTRARNVLATTFLESTFTDMIMVDDDVAWQQGAITRLVSHDVDVVAGAYPARGDNINPPFVLKPIGNELTFEPASGLMEVEGVPAGFLRINRRAIESIAAARKDRWYEDMTAPGMKIIDFFDFDLVAEQHQYFSEDYTFCRRWRDLGGKVWVDPELMLHHTGTKTFSGKFGDWLRSQDGKLINVSAPGWSPDRPLGGTELMVEGLKARLGDELDRVQLHVNYPTATARSVVTFSANKPQICWIHCDIDQEAAQWLVRRDNPLHPLRDVMDYFVFVSQWQRDRYIAAFDVDPAKCRVLRNATEVDLSPLPPRTGPVKLAYTSTPFRGLDVLLAAWEIAKLPPGTAELHIWSSMRLYGPDQAEADRKFETLYNRARSLPGVFFHGVEPNDVVRAALRGIDILAYPCTFAETSCISVIEALAAGCHVICPRYGALEETCGGLATLYEPSNDPMTHARGFAFAVKSEIKHVRTRNFDEQRAWAHARYDWTTRADEWRALIDEACAARALPKAAE
jgi:glycosyltransferase involved in cell wall biosynthesis